MMLDNQFEDDTALATDGDGRRATGRFPKREVLARLEARQRPRRYPIEKHLVGSVPAE